jgi:small-conductance mechanosensitive channel
VDTSPAPVVLFSNFGESSLNFELRVWIHDLYNFHAINSEIHEEIDRRFRTAHIEIAYPQHDLHLRSVDESICFTEPKSHNTE